MARLPFAWAKEARPRSRRTRNGSSLRRPVRRNSFGCCRPAQVKPSLLPTIRSIISGRAGFRTASALSLAGTNRTMECGFMCRIFPVENRKRFRRKGWTPRPLPFRPTASSWLGSARIGKGYLYSNGGRRSAPGEWYGGRRYSDQLESGWTVDLSLPQRRGAGEGVSPGIGLGKENGVEADCSTRSHRRVDHWTHPDDAGREDLCVWFPPDAWEISIWWKG